MDHGLIGAGNLLAARRRRILLHPVHLRGQAPAPLLPHPLHQQQETTFRKHEPLVRSTLLTKTPSEFLAFDDSDLLRHAIYARSLSFGRQRTRYTDRRIVAPQQIDNLYSDIVFLKLTPVADMSHEMNQIARRMWPFARVRDCHNRGSGLFAVVLGSLVQHP